MEGIHVHTRFNKRKWRVNTFMSIAPQNLGFVFGPWQQKSRDGSKPLRWDAIGDLNISYIDHVTNEEVRNKIQNAIGVHDDLLTMEKETQMIWAHLKILGHGEDNSAGDSERSKKERKTEEEMGR